MKEIRCKLREDEAKFSPSTSTASLREAHYAVFVTMLDTVPRIERCDSDQVDERFRDRPSNIGRSPNVPEVPLRGEGISVAIGKGWRDSRALALWHEHTKSLLFSMFIVAVLSNDDKLRASANDRGNRARRISIGGRERWGENTWCARTEK